MSLGGLKPSGWSWTPEIPKAWDIGKIVHFAGLRTGGTPDRDVPEYWEGGDIPWLASGEVNQGRVTSPTAYITDAGFHNSNATWLPPGSVLVALAGQGRTKGMAALLETPATCNQSLAAYICNTGRLYGPYLYYYLGANYRNLRGLVGDDLRDGLSLGHLSRVKAPLPPEPEQHRIAAFLDRKTAAIDQLIQKKERLIELLQEKRQALITHAVTKGLDPSVPMKDSGLPAVGRVPRAWQVLPLRRVVTEFVDYRGRTPTKVEEGVPLITAGAVRDGQIDHSRAPEYMAPGEYEEFMRRGRPRQGDLVFTSEAPLGEVALVEDADVAFAQRIILFRMNDLRMLAQYLWLFYQSAAGRDEIQSRGSGSTAEGIRADRLRGSAVLVPPLEEQRAIVESVRERLQETEPLPVLVAEQVRLLREYRQALISAAVTGQIDVSNEAA